LKKAYPVTKSLTPSGVVYLLFACIILAGASLIAASCNEPSGVAETAPGMKAVYTSEPPGKLICGVAEHRPMNYIENGEWTGFDSEFARLVGEKLGLEAEFQIIDWNHKFYSLNTGAIDAIWSGFGAMATENGAPRGDFCDLSYSYMLNTQCVVVKTDRLSEFSSENDLTGTTLAAVSGSSGEDYAKELAGKDGIVAGAAEQTGAFLKVSEGTADGAVADLILATQIAGSADYPGLSIAFELDPDVIAIGFRKGNNLRYRVNNAIKELYDDGVLLELARKYGVEDYIMLDTNFGWDDCDC